MPGRCGVGFDERVTLARLLFPWKWLFWHAGVGAGYFSSVTTVGNVRMDA